MDSAGEATGIRVWDLPTRIVHWLFALLIPLAWWTAEEHLFDWHRRIGYLLLGLLLFRLIWGLIGSSTARFASFVRGPAAIIRHLKGEKTGVGHSPLGALSVVAMLAAMIAQVVLGLFAIDVDGLESGPLADRISFDAARTVADLHETNFYILLGLIALHIAAILYYALIRRDDLVRPMIGGMREAPAGTEAMRTVPRWRVAAAGLAALLAMWWVSTGLAV